MLYVLGDMELKVQANVDDLLGRQKSQISTFEVIFGYGFCDIG